MKEHQERLHSQDKHRKQRQYVGGVSMPVTTANTNMVTNEKQSQQPPLQQRTASLDETIILENYSTLLVDDILYCALLLGSHLNPSFLVVCCYCCYNVSLQVASDDNYSV